ncbi:MAG TPA: adenylate/guanylate cyclase domain-containing protein [Burkholderiaceae bacterium]|nr:adenylate/guanylate cyclase domain-containing protein [Burkholderiaceae bacterium]
MSTSDFHPSVRTVLASFLFVDIVGFSKVPAAQQHAFKAGLISVLHRHLGALHRGDYRLRDTGDGALISFLSNPEHALYLALAIAEDLGRAAQGANLSLNDLRTGINLGAVKESIDVEQRPNYVGDGINAAQRIMDFAQPGQITASRSFVEAVAHLDAAYAALFQHLGARSDKHGREHELFSLAPSGAVLATLRSEIVASRPEQVEVDFDLDRLAPPMAIGPPPAAAAVPMYRHQWVLGLVALVLMTGLAVLIARALDGHEEPVAAPATVSPPVLAEPAAQKPTAEQPPAPAATPAPTPASAAAAIPEAPAAPAVAPRPAQAAVPRTVRKSDESPKQAPAVAPEPPAAAPANSAQASLRCSRIMQKAGVGEPLSPEEKKELANACR